MKRFLFLLLVCLTAFTGYSATIQWYSDQPATTSLNDGDIAVIETTGPQGYKSFTLLSLKRFLGTNGASVQYITNLYVENIYGSNAYVTNLTVVNEFNGKTVITTNLYSSNIYVTNLYLTQISTNYYLFSTNIYQSYPTYVNNTYVSNYFQTNAFLNTYVSNYFNTNVFNYLTNIYHFSTNLTVTNFYLTDNYISNFFNTNIFFVDNTVSNFFATNIYNTYNISSNYVYNFSQNLTNPVFYGDAFILPYEDHPNTYLQIVSANGYDITLDGWTGDITASGINADTYRTIEWTWDGPTNSMDMWTTDQYFLTYTPCSLTGFTDKPEDSGAFGYGWNGLLVITNASTTNILLTLPAGLRIPERTNQVTISNASQGMLSIKYSTKSGTNGVYRNF